MTPIQQLMLGVGAKKKIYQDDVFSNHLYDGDGNYQNIVNGVDLLGRGGMVWVKQRTGGGGHYVADSERGFPKQIWLHNANAESSISNRINSARSDGFRVGNDSDLSGSSHRFTSYTFAKQPGFFTMVTYTGSSTASWSQRQITHDLGSHPGMIWVKRTDASGEWCIWHRNQTDRNHSIEFNAASYSSTGNWCDKTPTDTYATVGANLDINGASYVMYIFAGGIQGPWNGSDNKAVRFTTAGQTYLDSVGANYIIGTNDFCCEQYVRVEQVQQLMGLWNLGNSGLQQKLGVALNASSSGNYKWRMYTGNGTSVEEAVGHQLGSNANGLWHHVCMTRESNVTSLFIDGRRVLKTSDSTNYNTYNALSIGASISTSNAWYGKICSFRLTIGESVYGSKSFIPPHTVLTSTSQGVTTSNIKLLCCQGANRTDRTIGSHALSENGSWSAVSWGADGPYDDPNAYIFGDNGDQNLIKTSMYYGNGTSSGGSIGTGSGYTNGPRIYCGWEPEVILIKQYNGTGPWMLFDSKRGMAYSLHDSYLRLEGTYSENSANKWLEINPDGFTITTNLSAVNQQDNHYIYMAIRRKDGLVSRKKTATQLFAMDTGNSSSTIPCFDSGFDVDYAWWKQPAGGNFKEGARPTGWHFQYLSSANPAGSDSDLKWDSETGFYQNEGSGTQAFMWNRDKTIDVVTYDGNDAYQDVRHGLGREPDMIWYNAFEYEQYGWHVYVRGRGYDKVMKLNQNAAEFSQSNVWGLEHPTANYINVDGAFASNQGPYLGISRIKAILFASVSGLSKVGTYSGSGSTGNAQNIGFQPRLLMIKRTNSTGDWMLFNSLGGFGNYMQLNTSQGQNSQTYVNVSSTGFSLVSNYGDTNESGSTYCYFAHA